jgi:hypothetical protein
VRTDALTAEEIEEAHHKAVSHWHKKRFVRKVWRNKFHYIKESAKHPLVALRIVGNMVKKGAGAG